MSRLPIPGQDNGTWGDVLNDYLTQAHNNDGTLKAGSVGAAQLQNNAVADATGVAKGVIQLAGDISGTAAAPQIAKIQGIALSGTPTAGQALIATSGTAASWGTLPAAQVSSVAGKTGAVTLVENDVANLSTDLAARPNDYVVSVSGGTYTATPRPGSGLAAYSGVDFTTVLQNAVTALTTGAPGAGSVGSGGGKIHITTGQYTMGNAVTITGWEGALNGITPFKSQLIIEGEGNGTKIVQNTSGQHGFIVKNAPQVSFLDMRGQVGPNAYAFIFGDKTGTLEQSFVQGVLRLEINSSSTTWPALYIKNFFDLYVEYLEVHSNANHGIVLENDSTSVYYGNSHFGYVRTHAAAGSPYAGLVIRSTNSSPLFGITFDNYQCINGYYGVYVNGTYGLTFNFVDIESSTYGVYLDGVTSGVHSSFVNILSGYVWAPSGGTCIYNAAGAFGNSITAHLDPPAAGGTNIPVQDLNTTLSPCNTYDLQLLNAAAANAMVFADATKQDLTVSCFDGTYQRRLPGAGTTAGSIVTIDGAQTLTSKTLTNPTLTNPKVSQINDSNGNAILVLAPGSASAVNHVAIYNEATGTGAAIAATGTDANVDLLISGQGTGKVKANNDGSYRQVATLDGAETLSNKTLSGTTFTNPKISQINDTNGNAILTMTPGSASAVNHVAIYNEAAGTGAAISATGSDTNVDLLIGAQGTGKVKANNDGSYRQVATLDGTETLAGKTLSSPTVSNPTFSGFTNGGVNFVGTNEALSMFSAGFVEQATLAAVSNSGNWSSIAAVNDAVLRAATNNLVITAKNNSGAIIFATGSTDTEKARITNAGQLTVGGVNVPTISSADVLSNKTLSAPKISSGGAPATASSTGTTGQVAWDAGYIYVCTATNTWVRAALTTW